MLRFSKREVHCNAVTQKLILEQCIKALCDVGYLDIEDLTTGQETSPFGNSDVLFDLIGVKGNK